MFNNLVDKVAFNFDVCELYINDKKFNLDWEFDYSLAEAKEPDITLRLYNSTPNIEKVVIKINGLEFATLVLNKNTDYYEQTTNQLTKTLELKLRHYSEVEITSIELLKANTKLSDYIETNNFDFKIEQDIAFNANESLESKIKKAFVLNNQLSNYSFTTKAGNSNLLLVHGSASKNIKITKIIEALENIKGTISIACMYNAGIFAGGKVTYKGKSYIVSEVQYSLSVSDGFIMKIFGETQNYKNLKNQLITLDSKYE